jgi:protein-S-isoprenylcysteine O-methyltransferase Ste14
MVLLIGAAMWAARWLSPALSTEYAFSSMLAGAISLSGIAIAWAGVSEFRRAQTTVDPTDPAKSSSVVTSGVYRYTRNPMYLGFLLVLAGWATWLSNLTAIVGPVFFVLYMNRFQILPEERILEARFGTPYEAYLQTVRRWV